LTLGARMLVFEPAELVGEIRGPRTALPSMAPLACVDPSMRRHPSIFGRPDARDPGTSLLVESGSSLKCSPVRMEIHSNHARPLRPMMLAVQISGVRSPGLGVPSGASRAAAGLRSTWCPRSAFDGPLNYWTPQVRRDDIDLCE
jgi:hypothetical protein